MTHLLRLLLVAALALVVYVLLPHRPDVAPTPDPSSVPSDPQGPAAGAPDREVLLDLVDEARGHLAAGRDTQGLLALRAAERLLAPPEQPAGDTQPQVDAEVSSPLRVALSNARVHLSQAFPHEAAVLRHAGEARGELDAAAAYLTEAEDVDPELRREVDEVRARLEELEVLTPSQEGALKPEALRGVYRELSRRLEALMARL